MKKFSTNYEVYKKYTLKIKGKVCPKDFTVKIDSVEFSNSPEFTDLFERGLFSSDSDYYEFQSCAIEAAGLSREYDEYLDKL